MGFNKIEYSWGNKSLNQSIQNISVLVTITTLILLLTLAVSSYLPLSTSSFFSSIASSPSSPSPFDVINVEPGNVKVNDEKCDVFSGKWVPNPEAPYYTNTTCWAIHEHQNCMKYGRPDKGFMKWRWKPEGCDLPVFNPSRFLEIMKGKSMAFVGDLISRNQVQSLICLLSKVEYPMDVSFTTDEKYKIWYYPNYNFTLASYESPFLIRSNSHNPTDSSLLKLYLDELDEDWTSEIEDFDNVVISADQWFYKPAMYYENGKIVGCFKCNNENITQLPMFYGYRKAFQKTFQVLNRLKNYKGTTILRTISPSHFENGTWNRGGNCLRTKPSNEAKLGGYELEFYLTQMEEFRNAERDGKKKGLRYRLLDSAQASILRPDGHPNSYGHWPDATVTLYNDCIHWCLPGPIDTWNDFLLYLMEEENGSNYLERKLPGDRKLKNL